MTPKIPSSLKWLIDKRARLDAEIKKTEKSLIKAQDLITELSTLKESMTAIDHALKLHEIQVQIELIRPVRSHYVRVKLPYGELTRSVLMCLRLRTDSGPVKMSEIVSFVEARNADLASEPESRVKLNRIVHNRLKQLCSEGMIQRHHSKQSSSEGLWSLAGSKV